MKVLMLLKVNLINHKHPNQHLQALRLTEKVLETKMICHPSMFKVKRGLIVMDSVWLFLCRME